MKTTYDVAIGALIVKAFNLSWWNLALTVITYAITTILLNHTPIGEELELLGWRLRWRLKGRPGNVTINGQDFPTTITMGDPDNEPTSWITSEWSDK